MNDVSEIVTATIIENMKRETAAMHTLSDTQALMNAKVMAAVEVVRCFDRRADKSQDYLYQQARAFLMSLWSQP